MAGRISRQTRRVPQDGRVLIDTRAYEGSIGAGGKDYVNHHNAMIGGSRPMEVTKFRGLK